MVDGAHVYPFEDLQQDTYHDIIVLCPNHHRLFDNHRIHLDKDGKNAIFVLGDGKRQIIPLVEDISFIDKSYIAFQKYKFDNAQIKIKKRE